MVPIEETQDKQDALDIAFDAMLSEAEDTFHLQPSVVRKIREAKFQVIVTALVFDNNSHNISFLMTLPTKLVSFYSQVAELRNTKGIIGETILDSDEIFNARCHEEQEVNYVSFIMDVDPNAHTVVQGFTLQEQIRNIHSSRRPINYLDACALSRMGRYRSVDICAGGSYHTREKDRVVAIYSHRNDPQNHRRHVGSLALEADLFIPNSPMREWYIPTFSERICIDIF